MKKRDIIKLVKETIKEMRSFYGSHDNFQPTGQRRNLSGMPGVMDEDALMDRAKKVYQAFINADKKGGTNFFKNVFKTLTGLDLFLYLSGTSLPEPNASAAICFLKYNK